MENNEVKNTGKNIKKRGIGAAIVATVLGGAVYLLYKAKKKGAADAEETTEFTSDTVIDEIPGEGEVD